MTSRCFAAGSALLLSLALASVAAAQEAPSPDAAETFAAKPKEVRALPCRPTVTCTAELVPQGTFEVESGYAQRLGQGKAIHSADLLLKVSVLERVQLQAGTHNLVAIERGHAGRTFDGFYGGPKVLLLREAGWLPSIAVSAMLMGPTRHGDEALQRTWDGYLWGYASKELLGLHADLNLGLNALGLDKKPAAQAVTALSVSRELVWGFGAVVELYGFHGGAPHAERDAGFLAGLSWRPIPEIVLDAGADTSLYADARALTLFAGATFLPVEMIGDHVRRAPPRVRSARAR